MDKQQFESMELNQLKELKGFLDKLVVEKEELARKQAKEELEKRAQELGFSVKELFGGKTTRKPTHRNPKDPTDTWAERSPGKKPGWLKEYLDNGGKLDDIRIKD